MFNRVTGFISDKWYSVSLLEVILPINCMRIWAPRVLESGRPQYGILGAHSLNCGWLNFSRFSHYLQGQFALPMHDNLSASHVGHFHTTTHPPNMVRKINHHYEFRHPQFELWAPTVWNCWWLNFVSEGEEVVLDVVQGGGGDSSNQAQHDEMLVGEAGKLNNNIDGYTLTISLSYYLNTDLST